MAKQTENNKLPLWVWIITSASLIGLLMFLFLLSKLDPPHRPSGKDTVPQTANSGEKAAPIDYGFYERLKEAVVPVKPHVKGEAKKPKDDSISLLQVASYRNREDADDLRVQLLLLNLEARIEKSASTNGDTWYRVITGPFASRSKLQHARSVLLSNRHEALLITRKPEKG